jgi:hypothetical protein
MIDASLEEVTYFKFDEEVGFFKIEYETFKVTL